MLKFLLVAGGVAAAAISSVSTPVWASDYPNQNIFMISGHAPGSGGDIVARFIGKKLGDVTGQTVVVENKPGAFTMLAIQHTSKAAPDGYTIHINSGNGYAMNPALFKEVPYDAKTSLAPVGTLMKLPFVLAVSKDSPFNKLEELTAFLVEKQDDATYGYSSNMAQVATSLYHDRINAKPVGVSYTAAPDALNELNAGLTDYIVADAVFLMEQAKSGNAKILAVTTEKRSSLAPEIPSFAESGVKDYDLGAWWGVWAPTGTPADVIAKLEAAVKEVVAAEDTKAFVSRMYAEPFAMSASEMTDYLAVEVEKWAELVSKAGIEKQ